MAEETKTTEMTAEQMMMGYAGQGIDAITDTNTPYLKLAQTISDEVNKNKPNYMPGLEPGLYFCALTKRIYGSTIQVVVLATRKAYAIIDDDNQFKGSADRIDPTWVRDAQGTLRDLDGNKVQLNYGYLLAPIDDLKDPVRRKDILAAPLVYTLKRTDISAARDWNTQIKSLKLQDGKSIAPIWAGVWELSAVYRESKKGAWYALSNGKTAQLKMVSYISALEDAKEIIPELAAASREYNNPLQSSGLLLSQATPPQIEDQAGEDF